MAWNKTKLTDFFRQHPQKQITIEEHGGTFRIQGKVQEVTELNMCSHILFETNLIPEIAGVEISLTFHDDFLGIQLLAQLTENHVPTLSFPALISYKNLTVSVSSENNYSNPN